MVEHPFNITGQKHQFTGVMKNDTNPKTAPKKYGKSPRHCHTFALLIWSVHPKTANLMTPALKGVNIFKHNVLNLYDSFPPKIRHSQHQKHTKTQPAWRLGRWVALEFFSKQCGWICTSRLPRETLVCTKNSSWKRSWWQGKASLFIMQI